MADIPKGQLDQYLLDTLFFKEYTLGIPGFSLGALDGGGGVSLCRVSNYKNFPVACHCCSENGSVQC